MKYLFALFTFIATWVASVNALGNYENPLHLLIAAVFAMAVIFIFGPN